MNHSLARMSLLFLLLTLLATAVLADPVLERRTTFSGPGYWDTGYDDVYLLDPLGTLVQLNRYLKTWSRNTEGDVLWSTEFESGIQQSHEVEDKWLVRGAISERGIVAVSGYYRAFHAWYDDYGYEIDRNYLGGHFLAWFGPDGTQLRVRFDVGGIVDILPLSDGGWVALKPEPNAQIKFFDESGELEQTFPIEWPEGARAGRLIQLPDGSFHVFGVEGKINTDWYLHSVVVNADGETVNSTRTPVPYADRIVAHVSGAQVIVTYARSWAGSGGSKFLYYNFDGDLLETRYFEDWTIYDFEPLADGGMMLTGSAEGVFEQNPFLVIMDADGSFVWERTDTEPQTFVCPSLERMDEHRVALITPSRTCTVDIYNLDGIAPPDDQVGLLPLTHPRLSPDADSMKTCLSFRHRSGEQVSGRVELELASAGDGDPIPEDESIVYQADIPVSNGSYVEMDAQFNLPNLDYGDYSLTACWTDDADSLLAESTILLRVADLPEEWHNKPQQQEGEPPPPELPQTFTVSQAWPNPFNGVTRLQVYLPQDGRIRVRVYDVLGRLVRDMAPQVLPAGQHTLNVDASELASGIYFAQIEAKIGDTNPRTPYTNRKLIVIK